MQNHVFLFQVHKDPELLDKILKNLSFDNHFFCVNIDEKSKESAEFIRVLGKYKNVLDISHFNIMHGGFSQVECTLYQIKKILNGSLHIDYFHTISGQDFPCVGPKSFNLFFELNAGKSYMMMDSDSELKEWRKDKYPHRMNHWYFMDQLNNPFFYKVHLSGILNRLLYWVPRKNVDINTIYGAWNWFSLHHIVVSYLMSFCDDNPEYLNRFKYTISSDELFFSSILFDHIEEMSIERRNSLRYIDWHPKRECRSLPLILEECDYNDVIESNSLFCRKIDCKKSAKLIQMLEHKIEKEEAEFE